MTVFFSGSVPSHIADDWLLVLERRAERAALEQGFGWKKIHRSVLPVRDRPLLEFVWYVDE